MADPAPKGKDTENELLAKLALERGYVTQARLREALVDQAREVAGGRQRPRQLGNILLSKGFISNDQLVSLRDEIRLMEAGTMKGAPGVPPSLSAKRAAPKPETPIFPPFGKYQLVRELGRGGMGVVYEAMDAQLNRRVALKMMLTSPNADPKEAKMDEERFLREARLSANLPKHPHIVSVHEAGTIDGKRYLAMEFIDGQPMSKWKKSGSVTIRKQVSILRDVAVAVHHAHKQGTIHRDLKPDNILIDAKNQPHVTDFGLAKSVGQNVSLSLTASGMVMGTPTHMSPEQAQGLKTIDHRTDIYALGVMLYETLTGRLPFQGETAIEILMKAMKNPVPPPSTVVKAGTNPTLDKTIENICLKCLAKRPGDRYATAEALAQDLAKWLRGEEVHVKVAPPRRKFMQAKKSHALFYGVAGSAVLFVIALIAISSSDPSDDAASTRFAAESARLEERKKAKGEQERLQGALENAQREAERARRESPTMSTPRPIDEGWIAEVRKLSPDQGLKRVVEKLQHLNPGFDGVVKSEFRDGAILKLSLWNKVLRDISPISALGDLQWFEINGDGKTRSSLRDLTPLGTLRKLEVVIVNSTEVSDLSPVKDLPLRVLQIKGTPVGDLGPLRSLRLRELACSGTSVSDLRPLQGMPLEVLEIDGTRVKDLSSLRNLRLRLIKCDFVPLRDSSILKSILTLEKINNISVAEFWKKYESVAGSPSDNVADPARWKAGIDLLALTDPERDKVAGRWSRMKGTLRAEDLLGGAESSRIELPFQPPDEYDLLVGVTPTEGDCDVQVVLSRGGWSVYLGIGARENTGFYIGSNDETDRGVALAEVDASPCWEIAKPHISVVQVRRDGIRAFVDGRLIADCKFDWKGLKVWKGLRLRNDALLGLGTWKTKAVFHEIKVLEVTGKGRFTGQPPAGPPSPFSVLWKITIDNRVKVLGQPVSLQKVGFEGATSKVKQLTEKELVVEMSLKGGGTLELRENPETLDEKVILELVRKAVGDPTPDMRRTIALLYASRGKFDFARRELERAKSAGADVAEAGPWIEYWEAVAEVTSAKLRKDWTGAKRASEWALKARPGDEEASKLLAEAEIRLSPPLTLDLGDGEAVEFVYIKPGTFTRGGIEVPKYDWQVDERPAHRVTITKAYFLGRYEVTRRQFAAFVNATGYKSDAERNGRAWGRRTDGSWGEIAGANWRDPIVFKQTDADPVICVSWDDAKAFCEWTTKKTGREVRLPTEAEWEYGCRAGTKTRFSFGDDESATGEYSWYDKNSGWATQPVGQKKPNPWGLYDMHGNVWEWCLDWTEPYASDAVDPTGPSSGDRRCVRGGGWHDESVSCRSAFRNAGRPAYCDTYHGFRVASR